MGGHGGACRLLLPALLLWKEASGLCDTHAHVTTDGYFFTFSVDFKFLRVAEDEDSHILESSNDAFQLFVTRLSSAYMYRLQFKLNTVSGVGTGGHGGGSVIHNVQLDPGVWHHVEVSKTDRKTCLAVNGASPYCKNKQAGVQLWDFQMKQTGDITVGRLSNFTGVEIGAFRQTPIEHAWYEENHGTHHITYYLVAIRNTASQPSIVMDADVSDITNARYVKPKYGTFQRLRYDCGYKLAGNLGFFEAKGTWTWQGPGKYLVAEGTPVKVAQNTTRDPYITGLKSEKHGAGASYYWTDRISGFAYPSFGSAQWAYVDGRQWSVAVFACNPQTETSRATWQNWATSPHGSADSKYMRIWLGVETNSTMTTTTTGTCTTTSSTETFTSSTTSNTSTTTEGLTSTTSTTSSSVSSSSTSTTSPFSTTSTSSSSSSTTASTSTATTSTATTSTVTTATTSTVTSTSSTSSTSTATTTTETTTVSTTSTLTLTTTTSSTETTTVSTTSTVTTTATTSTVTTLTSTTTSSRTETTTVTTTSTATATVTTGTETTGTTATSTATTTSSSSTSSSSATATSTVSSTSSSSSSSSSTSTRTSSSSTSSSTSSSSSSSSSTSSSSTTVTTSTSSSSTSSSTSTSTSSTSTTTTWATADDLLRWLSGHEQDLLTDFPSPGVKSKLVRMPGVTLMAFSLDPEPGAASVAAAVAGSDAAVEVPASTLRDPRLAGAVGVATVFDSELAGSVGPLKVALNLNFFNTSKLRVSVDDTADPILITLPANRSRNQSCSFWDEDLKEWSKRGLWEVPAAPGDEQGPMVCAAKHLTLFGAFVEAFLTALLCAQTKLLTPEAVVEIFSGDWWLHPVSLLFWLLNLILAALFLAAFLRDYRRAAKGGWDDECFLIPLSKGPAAEEGSEGLGSQSFAMSSAELAQLHHLDRQHNHQAEELPMAEVESGDGAALTHSVSAKLRKSAHHGSRATLALIWSAAIVATAPCRWCWQISAVRDAVDDIFSRWFSYFGQIRSFCEGVCSDLRVAQQEGDMRGTCGRVSGAVVSSLITSSVKRQVSASMGLSEENVAFITDDEDLGNLLLDAALVITKVEARGPGLGQVTKWERHLFEWHKLHASVLDQFDKHWHETSWRSFPSSAMLLMLAGVPFTNVFFDCRFTPSSLRMLLFTSELYGNFLVATLFYQASSPASDKKQADPKCLEEPEGLAAEMGRILAIAIAAIFIASLPVAILGSLHARGFRKLAYAGCPEWQQQLKVWKMQDRIIWIVGSAYNTFCLLFVMSFLANVAAVEIPSWGAMGGLTLLEDTLIIPFSIAFLVPLLAALSLSALSGMDGKRRREILDQKRAELETGSGNWRKMVLAI